ncbi:MAG: prenyltransferase [Candidatus Omnitrophica bacterium]|nr:prenyltransferase [Candidatus Omnitrophota bacterium]
MPSKILRALRLPFITASSLPFIFGSLVPQHDLKVPEFLLGITAAVSMHLSANLINDYADSRSPADWQDRNFYGFFGGSKLIQEGVFPCSFFFNLAVFFAALAAAAVVTVTILSKSLFVLLAFCVIAFLGWSYSAKPLQFAYRKLGEIVIFILFGPALVMGGYFLQTGIFPDAKSFMLSVPFGLLTTAILFANEVPDLEDDVKSGKYTLVSLTGAGNAYLYYALLTSAAFLTVILNVALGFLKPAALLSLGAAALAIKAAMVLKNYHHDKIRLVESSKLTVLLGTVTAVILIFGLLI